MARIVPLSEKAIERAAQVLRAGGLVAFPTDTVYGLCALPTPAGVAALFRAKLRPQDKPVPLLLANADLLPSFTTEIPPLAGELASSFWPGALTLVLHGREDIARALGSRDGTIGVRAPDHESLRRLIASCGGALAVTSANRSGEPESRTAEGVDEQLGDRVDLIVDAGPSPSAGPSTVIDLTAGVPRVLRPGSLTPTLERLLTAGTLSATNPVATPRSAPPGEPS